MTTKKKEEERRRNIRHRSSNCHIHYDELTTKSRAFSSKISAAASLPRSSHWSRSRHTRRSTQPSAAVANMEKATVEIDSLRLTSYVASAKFAVQIKTLPFS